MGKDFRNRDHFNDYRNGKSGFKKFIKKKQSQGSKAHKRPVIDEVSNSPE